MNFEVGIPLQIIGEKAHATFQRHDLRSHGKGLHLFRRKGAPAAFHKAVKIRFKQVQITGYLRQVFLILQSRAGAEPDGIAEIMGGKPRHHGVQVDDTDGLSGFPVKKDIVQLGIVVRYPERQLSGFQQIAEEMAVLLPFHHKPDLLLHPGGPSHHIRLHGFPEFGEPVHGIVEIGNRLVQLLGGKIRQEILEISKGVATLFKILRAFRLVKAGRICNEGIHPPSMARLIPVIGMPVHRADHLKGLTVRISALETDFPGNKAGYPLNVLHQLILIAENFPVDPLKNILDFLSILPKRQPVGIVDMTAAVGHRFQQFSRKRELFKYLIIFKFCHLCIYPHKFSGYRPSAFSLRMAASTTGLSSL